MLFGLTNAPGSFHGYINKILAEKLYIFVIVYLDDIFIYTKDPEKTHVKAVWWVLEVLRKYGLYANLKKCRFHKNEVRLLDFVVFRDGIRMEEQRIDAVKSGLNLSQYETYRFSLVSLISTGISSKVSAE